MSSEAANTTGFRFKELYTGEFHLQKSTKPTRRTIAPKRLLQLLLALAAVGFTTTEIAPVIEHPRGRLLALDYSATKTTRIPHGMFLESYNID